MIKFVLNLFKYCFYFLLFIFFRANPIKKNSFGKDLRVFLERMGPIFIKIGQFLSTRSDLFDSDTIDQLALLKDSTRSFSFKYVKKTVEKDLNCRLENLFSSFEEKPIASASISQVHSAITKDYQKVAVKVIRPNIEKEIQTLKTTIFTLLKIVNFFTTKVKRLKLLEVFRLFFKRLDAEIDFRLEGANATRFKEDFFSNDSILIPRVFWNLTSKKVLTLEWIPGIDCKLRRRKINDNLIQKAVYCFFDQVFIHGFFHGDMHSGNIVFFESQICFLDFGIMGHASKKIRLYLFETLAGFVSKDYNRVANAHFDFGYVDELLYSRAEFTIAMMSVGEKIVGKQLNEIKISDLLLHLFDVVAYFDMEIQLPLLLLQKNSLIFEDLIKSVDPEANLWMHAEKWIENRSGIIQKVCALGNIKIYSGVEKIRNSIKCIVGSISSKENNKIDLAIKLHLILLIAIIIIIL